MGYAGGTTSNPTYRRIGDHAECIQVEYDSSKLTYSDLLQTFLTLHDPTSPRYSTQYASMVLAEDDAQSTAAQSTLQDLGRATNKNIGTQVVHLNRFYLAEDYHQKYSLRADKTLMREFREYYPDEAGLRESTAAARVNGYLYGAGQSDALAAELDTLGLSPRAAEYLVSKVSRR